MPLLSPITDSINNKSRPYARPKKSPRACADPLTEDFVHSAFILDLLWMAGWVHQFLNSNWFLQSGQRGASCQIPTSSLSLMTIRQYCGRYSGCFGSTATI